jgi:hypothetical protein
VSLAAVGWAALDKPTRASRERLKCETGGSRKVTTTFLESHIISSYGSTSMQRLRALNPAANNELMGRKADACLEAR